MRLELWRELLAGLFDHPLLQPELRRLTSIRVDVARPGSVTRLTRAALFVGWLAAMLDWQVERPLQLGADGGYQGILKSGRRQIPVELRPVGTTIDGPVRGTGSLVRVDLEASRVRTMLRVRVTRQSDHLLATADWNGAPVARRPARLEAFDETPFLAEALDRTGHDPVFELALERAVRLTAALVPPAPGTGPVTGSSAAGTA
jgi:glucose-6-phosphate dehydrogenase assembly protein OpcA